MSESVRQMYAWVSGLLSIPIPDRTFTYVPMGFFKKLSQNSQELTEIYAKQAFMHFKLVLLISYPNLDCFGWFKVWQNSHGYENIYPYSYPQVSIPLHFPRVSQISLCQDVSCERDGWALGEFISLWYHLTVQFQAPEWYITVILNWYCGQYIMKFMGFSPKEYGLLIIADLWVMVCKSPLMWFKCLWVI